MPLTPRMEFTIWFLNEGKSNACIVHYKTGGTLPTQGDVDTATADFASAISTDLSACITTETSFNGVTGRYVGAASGFVADDTASNLIGLVTGDTLPAECAAIVRKIGNGPPKRAHGTMFIPCVPESFTENSRLKAASILLYIDFLAQLSGFISSGPMTFVLAVMSRASADLFTVGALQVQSVLGHQRRRRPFR